MAHPFNHNAGPGPVALPYQYARYYHRRLVSDNGWNQAPGDDVRTEIMSIPQPPPRRRDVFGRLIPTALIGPRSAWSYRVMRQAAFDAANMAQIRSRRMAPRRRRRIAFARGYPLSGIESMRR